jgi:hypothetical protein
MLVKASWRLEGVVEQEQQDSSTVCIEAGSSAHALFSAWLAGRFGMCNPAWERFRIHVF